LYFSPIFYFQKFGHNDPFVEWKHRTGILAMPNAFKNTGIVVGNKGTLLMGIICTHCMYVLVRSCY